MREIIFRGKDYKGKWVYGSLVEHKVITSNGKISSYNILYQDENDWGSFNEIKQCSVEKETVGQFTGLTDKNGKKIFEGDIVKGTISSAWAKEEIICEVRFINDGYYCVEIRQDNVYQHKLMFSKKLEIIGNIWDNPKLIKENEND